MSINLEKLSEQELRSLNASVNVALQKRADEKKNTKAYRQLADEKTLLEKEIESILKDNKKFTFSVNLPLTFEVTASTNVDDIDSLADGDSLFYYEGTIKLPKAIDGLTKDQTKVIKTELQERYDSVCDDFITPFVPKEISSVEEVLIKKCSDWKKRIAKAGYTSSDF